MDAFLELLDCTAPSSAYIDAANILILEPLPTPPPTSVNETETKSLAWQRKPNHYWLKLMFQVVSHPMDGTLD